MRETATPPRADRLPGILGEGRMSNSVVLAGDVRSSWVNDSKADFDDPASARVGTELARRSAPVANGADTTPATAGLLAPTPGHLP